MINVNFNEEKCVCCGKSKIIRNPAEYVYKIKGKFCCSYTCYRELQKIVDTRQRNDVLL